MSKKIKNYSQEESICFLLSFNNSQQKKFNCPDNKYEIFEYHYNDKIVLFIEIFIGNKNRKDKKEIKILYDNIQYLIKVFDKKYLKRFLFQYSMINVKENKEYPMNDLEIEEEFDIHFKMAIKKEKREDFEYLFCLFAISKDILISNNKFSTFSFFLTLYTKKLDKYFCDYKLALKKIKHIGNIKKIDESNLHDLEIYVLYKIFTDFNALNNNITEYMKKALFECLKNYPNLIDLSEISKKIDVLIDISKTSTDILLITNYIKNIKDFLYIVYHNIKKLTKLFEFSKAQISLNRYFLTFPECDDEFYFHLYQIKTIEEVNYKFLKLDCSPNDFIRN